MGANRALKGRVFYVGFHPVRMPKLEHHQEGRAPAVPEHALYPVAPGAAGRVIRCRRQAAAVVAQTLATMNASTSAAW
jgi:hypothetical protein